MQFIRILTPLLAALVVMAAMPATAQNVSDEVLLQMHKAFRKGDRAQLTQLLPQAAGSPIEAWAAYWELKARLESASDEEVQAFFQRFAHGDDDGFRDSDAFHFSKPARQAVCFLAGDVDRHASHLFMCRYQLLHAKFLHAFPFRFNSRLPVNADEAFGR